MQQWTKLLPIAFTVSSLIFVTMPAHAQLYTADKAGLVEGVHDYKNSWWESIMVDRMFDFKLSPRCWQKMTEKDGWGIKVVANAASSVGAFVKAKGWGDLEAAESANNNDRENNKPRVEEMINGLKPKLHFTLITDGIKCTDAEWDLVHRMWSTAFEALEDGRWKPKFDEIYLSFTFSQNAKDISVSNSDGKHFSVTAPSLVEPEAWDEKIIKGLNRTSGTPKSK